MSDDTLRIIATDPNWVPHPISEKAAVELLTAWLPDAEDVSAVTTDEIQFIDSGVNLQNIRCPGCQSAVPMDWWNAAVTKASEDDFEDLLATMPCCSTRLSLNDLEFDWPVGFALFVIDALNPNVEDLSSSQLDELTRVLGVPLRRIWQHL